jgi:hypothetical protein
VDARDIAQAKGFIAPPGYRRHRPETTLLYALVAEHYPKFRDRRAAEGRPLPRYVEDEFEAYLKRGRLEHGFLRVKCETCQAEKLVAFSCKRRGFYSGHPALRPSGQPSAVQNRSRRFCLPELRRPANGRRVQGCTRYSRDARWITVVGDIGRMGLVDLSSNDTGGTMASAVANRARRDERAEKLHRALKGDQWLPPEKI